MIIHSEINLLNHLINLLGLFHTQFCNTVPFVIIGVWFTYKINENLHHGQLNFQCVFSLCNYQHCKAFHSAFIHFSCSFVACRHTAVAVFSNYLTRDVDTTKLCNFRKPSSNLETLIKRYKKNPSLLLALLIGVLLPFVYYFCKKNSNEHLWQNIQQKQPFLFL